MWYNIYEETKEQKERYIKQSNMSEDAEEFFRRITSTAAKVETQEKTDLSNFNRIQVKSLLKTYDARSRYYLRLICNTFTKYYQWCLSEKLVDITNVTDWYDVKLSKAIIEEVLPNELIEDKFFGDEEMLEYISRVPDPTNKLYLYAPYIGIDGEDHVDMKNLKISDLSEDKQELQLFSGKTIPVDELFIKLIKEADKAVRYNPDGTGEYHSKSKNTYSESIYVFKTCTATSPNVLVSSNIINSRIRFISKQTGNKFLNTSLIYKNGLLNYIKKYYESEGITLYDALFTKRETNKRLYKHDEKTQELIHKFGSNMLVKMLRYQMSDVMHYYE